MSGNYGDSTRSLKAVDPQAVSGQPVAPQPVLAATYHLSGDETAGVDSYGRNSNPTWRQLESALAELEGAGGALVFGSGMAAISAVLRALAPPGSTVVVPADGYYQVRRHAAEDLAPAGVTVIEASSAQIYDAAATADVVLAETPTNPALDVVGLHRLAIVCHGRGARLVVDNTAATPLGQQPLSLGADAVVASATKALSGHSDLLAGYVATSRPELLAAVERQRLLAGAILGGFEAWLLLRSLGTAGLRFERQCQNARAVATLLARHPAVRAVRYPGLAEHPGHAVARAQMRRFGGLVAVELADAAAVRALLDGSELLIASTSFGGLHTSVDRRARWGDAVPDGFARISLGIEDTDDLLADIERALLTLR
ncbi:cystathionine gamma-lyase [Mycobacterium avium subsp. paratuberculosis]|uniref:Cystathionine gamma-lyase n=1 Tax=Mycolicibacterium paratuberculosis (strain ATCC BAA-968 / K-10) TaxID=262316 RepID=Q73VG1_MYCPA|nr:cystathionine gamma-lyase [Mycobacterium avium]ELP45337.1 cystathionine gamma-lyase [Mycobacterium avium subsp. paratuberculosis S5]ETB05631.1 cystathionine gamma-lyase [Mycobacterium avium subsp. paratuberculosis 10-4404]ETB07120.1 cystathionine gamma-lyase [Mycobacterium avium subsp. paratuberculosis 10-5864]ETB34916.1 cystathionine gamma-lyase [Mycobacterium avium subsp. paratuberculosis 10-5975]ETB48628.1 cystathionine gamma-lyase [Mycobacterium avium subsp. paratuberculosis 10-8425]